MELRLGLLNMDLAKPFDISEALCSHIYLAWLHACITVLNVLVYVPDQDALIGSTPERLETCQIFTPSLTVHNCSHKHLNIYIYKVTHGVITNITPM